MKPIFIILRFFLTLAVCFAGSFLLDVEIIRDNWLRYTVVVVAIALFFTFMLKLTINDIKKL